MKVNNKEEHNMDVSVLFRRGDKILIGGSWCEGLEKMRGREGERGEGSGIGGNKDNIQRFRNLSRVCSNG